MQNQHPIVTTHPYVHRGLRPSVYQMRSALLIAVPRFPESSSIIGVQERLLGLAGLSRSKGTISTQLRLAMVYGVITRLGQTYRYTRVETPEERRRAQEWTPMPKGIRHRTTEGLRQALALANARLRSELKGEPEKENSPTPKISLDNPDQPIV